MLNEDKLEELIMDSLKETEGFSKKEKLNNCPFCGSGNVKMHIGSLTVVSDNDYDVNVFRDRCSKCDRTWSDESIEKAIETEHFICSYCSHTHPLYVPGLNSKVYRPPTSHTGHLTEEVIEDYEESYVICNNCKARGPSTHLFNESKIMHVITPLLLAKAWNER